MFEIGQVSQRLTCSNHSTSCVVDTKINVKYCISVALSKSVALSLLELK